MPILLPLFGQVHGGGGGLPANTLVWGADNGLEWGADNGLEWG